MAVKAEYIKHLFPRASDSVGSLSVLLPKMTDEVRAVVNLVEIARIYKNHTKTYLSQMELLKRISPYKTQLLLKGD